MRLASAAAVPAIMRAPGCAEPTSASWASDSAGPGRPDIAYSIARWALMSDSSAGLWMVRATSSSVSVPSSGRCVTNPMW